MKTNENQKSTHGRRVYLPSLKVWAEVTEAQYYAYYRDIWAVRKRAQTHGQCMCPKAKLWLCGGDCPGCEFHAPGDTLSLDNAVEDGGGEGRSWAETLQDDAPSAVSMLMDQELLGALYEELERLDPEGKRICALLMEGLSEREAAAGMDMARSTFKRHWAKIQAKLRDRLRAYYLP